MSYITGFLTIAIGVYLVASGGALDLTAGFVLVAIGLNTVALRADRGRD